MIIMVDRNLQGGASGAWDKDANTMSFSSAAFDDSVKLARTIVHEYTHALITTLGKQGKDIVKRYSELTGWNDGNPQTGPTAYSRGELGAVDAEEDLADSLAAAMFPVTDSRYPDLFMTRSRLSGIGYLLDATRAIP